ncbi:platelet glycoprotein V-like isoform X3 [Sycon ciliatum]|uniref:platelet glycoprotein V-like isoform X3 n=1 Tax=Sycon ciliatum TaxID=27933 RepID=UPI0031F663F5
MNASNLCLLSVAVIYMVLAWSEPSSACYPCSCSNGVVMSCPNNDRIVLGDNQLVNLSAGLFDTATRLKYLQLYDNQLVGLPAGLFDATTNLQELDLSNNRIDHLPAGLFKATTKLEELDLTGNQLVRLPAGLFKATTKFESLDLSNNNLRYLPSGVPHDTPQLNILYLDNAVSLNLRLCALKFPNDFSQGNILSGADVKNYIASNLTEAICRQNCSIISSMDNCSSCTGYLFNYTCLERDECLYQIHNCDSNAVCTNTVGSYNCTCNSGF